MRAFKRLVWMVLALGAAAASAQQKQMQIQYAERVEIQAAAAATSFEAYGRHFALELESNERLLQGVPSARKAMLAHTQLLRGKLAGIPESWVRLTMGAGQVTGAIWDGNDLYVVARYSEVARFLTNPLEVEPDTSVVFRLADTIDLLPANFCATGAPAKGDASHNGLAQYQSMVRELKLQFVAAPTDQIDISLIADSPLVQQYAGPNDDIVRAMLNTLNLVDGIYDSQLGLMITASDVRPLQPASDPFTSNDSSGLLAQLRTFRSSIPAVQSRPVAHLLTSHVLDGGQTLGIANLSGACDATNGVSLTSIGFGGISSNAFLIMAHELGHNLGAEHDTESCGTRHIMWPTYDYDVLPTFSQCSLDAIKPFIAAHRGTCITPAKYGDIVPRIGAIASPLNTEPFVWPVYVKNAGTIPTTSSTVTLNLPNATLNGATLTQGTCTPSNGQLVCTLGTLAAGAEARIDLNFTSTYIDTLHMLAIGDAANDRYDNNNIVEAALDVLPQATLGVSVAPASQNANVGDIVTYTFTVAASGPRTTRAVTMNLFAGAYVQIISAAPTQGTCNTSGCTFGDMSPETTVRVTVRAKGLQGESLNLGAQINSANAYSETQSAYAALNATATYDLAIVSPGSQALTVGVPFTLAIPVHANGTRAVSGGVFQMLLPGATIASVDVDGTPCLPALLQGAGCPLGTVSAGGTKIVTVHAQFDMPYETSVNITAQVDNDELWSNNSANLYVFARYATDVTLDSITGGGNTEGKEFEATAYFQSVGAQSASNVTSTFSVPVGVRILSATLTDGTCTVESERRVTCTRALLASSDGPLMRVQMIGDVPATYSGTWTIAAANDGAPANNSFNVDIFVGPLADVGINPIPTLPGFIVGQPREFTVEVFTGSLRPVDNVDVTFPTSAFLGIQSAMTAVGTCDITGLSPHCALGTLPPNSLVRITLRYLATSAGSGLSGWVSVSAGRDVDYSNNSAEIRMNTYDPGDVEVRAESSSVSGTVGDTISLPAITVTGINRTSDVWVEIPLPAFTAFDSISGSAICTGTAVLQCYFGQVEPGSTNTLVVRVKLNSTGTASTNVLLHAANDSNAANDSASFQVMATTVANPPASPPSNPPSSGGGGGGRFEWVALVFLGLLTLRRARRVEPRRVPAPLTPAHGRVAA